MNILLLGASGYAGHAAALALHRAGHAVMALLRPADTARARRLPAQHICQGVGPASDNGQQRAGRHQRNRGHRAARQQPIQSTPLGRLGQPDDIAEVVGFLASLAARWLTGQHVRATGSLM